MTDGHGHGHGQQEQAPFLPDAHFAVQAQAEEIDDQDARVKILRDQKLYLRATVLQLQAEAQHRQSLLLGQIEQEKALRARADQRVLELEEELKGLRQLSPDAPAPETGPQIAEEAPSPTPAYVGVPQPSNGFQHPMERPQGTILKEETS